MTTKEMKRRIIRDIKRAGFKTADGDGIASDEPRFSSIGVLGHPVGHVGQLDRHEWIGTVASDERHTEIRAFGLDNLPAMQELARHLQLSTYRHISAHLVSVDSRSERFQWESVQEMEDLEFSSA